MNNFFDFTLSDLEALLENLGLKRYRARQIFKWVYQEDTLDFDAMTNLQKGLRITLTNLFSFGLPDIREIRTSIDGTTKFMFSMKDQGQVETVFIPEKGRNTLCVSTQIGCKMACRFCVTGKIGFVRDLSVAEIVGQVVSVKRHLGERKLTNLVFMGMGEPLDNVDNLLKAIQILKEPFGLKFSHRKITVSTVGLLDGLRSIQPKVAQLAISLNAATDAGRTDLMPINRIYHLHEIIEYVKGLKDMGRNRVTFEYVLLGGVNDSLQDAKSLCDLLAGTRCKINLIPYNESPYAAFKAPAQESVNRFHEYLMSRHFTAIVRDSRGRDIAGACGQLGMQYLEKQGR